MTQAVFDTALLRQRMRRALSGPAPVADFLLTAVADDLVDRLAAVKRQFDLAADIATPLPTVADQLASSDQVSQVARLAPLEAGALRPKVVGSAEALPFAPGCLDLAVSALAFQFVNDLPGTFIQIRQALKPDGLFLAALLGGETLTELRQAFAAAEAELTDGAAPRVAPFAEVRTVGALLQRAGFALPVVDIDRMSVRYATMFDLVRDLRAMGATNPLIERSRRPLPRTVATRAAAIYAERFADPDGRVRATFDVIWLSGWTPHESQQQPLPPGSARTRLADALGVTERSAGEKAGG
ncbi:methyltransferase domain-containing protein [Bauldia sp.]|uniref:methyltransferase domain-containing protein n=1 Tax=Bauldia sp. TaxID=2575872 RepID=UPI003BAA6D77